ncbi:MAG: aminopeptidase P family protein [Gemmatimonadales bacterium]|nr:aminopeptidase P family protein [Gemmatimonadales bacterium]
MASTRQSLTCYGCCLLALLAGACGDGTTGPRADDPCLDARVEAPTHPFSGSGLRARREALLATLQSDVAILPAARDMGLADGDPDRPESDFYYLTGLGTKGAWLVLAKRPGEAGSVTLYVDTAAVLHGPTVRARHVTGVADVRCLADAALELPGLIDSVVSSAPGGTLFLSSAVLGSSDRGVLALIDTSGLDVQNVQGPVTPFRLLKGPEELRRLRVAAQITAAGLRAGIRTVAPGLLESDIEEVIESSFSAAGAGRRSFASIVASGPNAVQLHYNANTSMLTAGDVMVIDVGAEYARYAGDVTRTVPVSGTFTARQRALYELVLGTKEAAAAMARPGMTLLDLDQFARDQMALLEAQAAGLCPGGCHYYFGHALSHFVGLDVHDVGMMNTPLEPGMVITIEPGIYLSGEGIGIRIEDDYLVTETGLELLSTGMPTSVEEIEALMAGS